jgi:[NiFe] hydrogenase diaphorase moiety small subunit
VRASRDLDGKHVFQFVGRGKDKRIWVNAEARLADTPLRGADKAVDICPVGAILRKRVGYRVPVGQRLYDVTPIGSDIEDKRPATPGR